MSMKWWTECSRRRNRPGSIALTAFVAVSVALMPACSLLPDEPEVEDLPAITPPKLSERPTYEVKTETIETRVQGIGKVMSTKEETLFFRSSGEANAGSFRVKEVYVETGQQVEAGQLIAELDVSEKERELRRAKLEFRQEELNMIQILRKQDEYEPEELEQLKIDFELKRTSLVELEETIANAKLTAPFSGTIVAVHVQPGDTVEAYDPVAVLADLSQLTVAAEFSRDSLRNIAVGMDAVVNINTFGQHRGKVERLPVQTDSNQQNPNPWNPNPNPNDEDSIDKYVLVKLDEFPEGVTRGTPLSVLVITERKENAVVIPPAALRSYGGRSYVQVQEEDGTRREVDVEVGLRTSTQVEIIKGLEPGQKVVGQ